MAHPWIPLLDARPFAHPHARPALPAQAQGMAASALTAASEQPLDALQRPLRELRISLTDRCNLRCRYCMPREHFDTHTYLPRADLLQDAEIVRLAKLFAQLGVHKLRLTGGEPLLRRHLPALIAQLSALRTPQGQRLDICLTSNGLLLPQKAADLKAAGLSRLSVSLDALDDATFRRMADVNLPVQGVLDGIAAAQAAGLGAQLKLNMVVQRGVNEDQVLPMARYARDHGLALRLIEYMDVGSTNGWQLAHVVPSHELLARLQTEFDLHPLPRRAGETAQRWAHGVARQTSCPSPNQSADEAAASHPAAASANGKDLAPPAPAEIGFISSVTEAFCSDCTRLRLSADGQLYTCLFATQGHDLRALLRSSASDADLLARVAQVWGQRSDRHSQVRQHAGSMLNTATPNPAAPPAGPRIEMSYIGG